MWAMGAKPRPGKSGAGVGGKVDRSGGGRWRGVQGREDGNMGLEWVGEEVGRSGKGSVERSELGRGRD